MSLDGATELSERRRKEMNIAKSISRRHKKGSTASLPGIDENSEAAIVNPTDHSAAPPPAHLPVIKRKDTQAIKESIGYILRSPVRCHYLMEFCKREFNTENAGFLIKVSLFRELMDGDKTSWPKSWHDTDKMVASKPDLSTTWPSSSIDRAAVVEVMQSIYEEFLDEEEAPELICISKEMLDRTRKRMELIDLFGPEVFMEATLDPIKTVKRDILPRFIVSELYKQMMAHIEALPRTMTEFTEGAMEYAPKVETSTEESLKYNDKSISISMHDRIQPVFTHVIDVYTNISQKAKAAVGFHEEESMVVRTLLSRQVWYVVPRLLFLNFLLNLFLGLDYYFSDTPACNDPHVFGEWVWMVDYTICVAFIVTILLNINHLNSSRGQLSHELSAALITNICTGLMAGTANVLIVAFNYGGTCRDAFGVPTPAAQWPEWCTTVPYLVYTAIAVDDKEKLDWADTGAIFSMFLCIFTGAILNLPMPLGAAQFFLFISCVAMGGVVGMVIRAHRALNAEVHSEEADSATHTHKIAIAAQSRNLAWLCLVGMPVLPILYFFKVGNYMSDDTFYAANNITSCIIKLVFASIAAEGHTATASMMYKALENNKEAKSEAEAFAEHLFQRVSIPLKAVIAGLELLEDSAREKSNTSGGTIEVMQLNTLRSTTAYIHDNLTDLLHADRKKIKKEDALRLLIVTFNVKSFLQSTLQGLQKLMQERLVSCKLDVKKEVPLNMVGDVSRLEHALTILMSVALQTAPQKSKMILSLFIRKFKEDDTKENGDNWVKPFTEEELMGHESCYSENSSELSSNAPSRKTSNVMSANMRSDSNVRDSQIRRRSLKSNKRKMYSFCVEVSRSAALTDSEDGYFLNDGCKYLKGDTEVDQLQGGESKYAMGESKYADRSPVDLALAREIVVLHGGSVFWSSRGKTTAVGFAIPYEVIDGKVSALSV